jgi:thymidylate synthase (FAD)
MKVLDNGLIELVDMLGDDRRVAQIARISYMSKDDPQKDEQLIELLMKLGHESPFEHIVFTFHVKAPIFVARQWMRHRIASINERSGRYTKFNKDDFYIPDSNRMESEKDKDEFIKSIINSFEAYNKLLDSDVNKEVARLVLPLTLYTEWYWTINFRSLMNFLNLRADTHAQYEIRQYAITIANIVKEKIPNSYKYFIKYRYTGNAL